MSGTLYGVGVGPGDARLMTYLAVETIARCPVIAVPAVSREKAVSYRIASGLVKDLEEKQCLCLAMPMTKDRRVLEAAYEAAADQTAEVLAKGHDVAFLTLGDPTIYSTYIYLHRLIRARGFAAEIINGVPSFCAVSARLGESLADRSQQLHIVPSTYGVEEALALPGTKVLMKAGSKMALVKELLRQRGEQAAMVENCGMEHERIFTCAQEIPDEAGYYSLIVVREGKE